MKKPNHCASVSESLIWDAVLDCREIRFRATDGRKTVTLSFGRAAGARYCEVRTEPEHEMHVIWLREASEDALLGEIISMIERDYPILDDTPEHSASAHA